VAETDGDMATRSEQIIIVPLENLLIYIRKAGIKFNELKVLE